MDTEGNATELISLEDGLLSHVGWYAAGCPLGIPFLLERERTYKMRIGSDGELYYMMPDGSLCEWNNKQIETIAMDLQHVLDSYVDEFNATYHTRVASRAKYSCPCCQICSYPMETSDISMLLTWHGDGPNLAITGSTVVTFG